MDTEQEKTEKIAVIGAGIVGVSSALHLQRLGASVTLVDRKEPGDEDAASYGNGGVLARCSVIPVVTPGIMFKAPVMLFGADGPLFLRWSYMPRLLPWLIPYLRSSTRKSVEHIAKNLAPLLFDSVDEHFALAKGTDAARWLHACEYMFLYKNRSAFEGDALAWGLRREHGFKWDILEGEAVRAFSPDLSPDYQYAVVMRDHGKIVQPGNYVRDLAAAFAAAGGTVLRASIKDVDTGGDGIVLKTDGQDIAVDKVVIAAGAWSHQLAKKLGATVPLESERGYHVELLNPSKQPTVPIMDVGRKMVATPMDGSLRLAGTLEFGGLDAPASKGPPELLMRGARAMLPGLEFESKKTWMGHRPAPTDSLPVLGPAPGSKKVFFAYGHHHVGLTAGPKTGRIIAQHVMGLQHNINLDAYRCDRFN
ncbi:MAG: FAD-binding oxidoreductase [Rhodospirillaceae bacterium]|jgi:D-amino-acid dehydrogenase|nr:FAD-binding oxidoreductase [Rhodospirillaceae bacterium]MBT5561606.1 FAD-binding oxidoreductase [Rhodospirillaceae bacterium]MBT6241798.1 FAD-binding oxidoreductase [Rhodospirillaceae bacterium]